jgi:hypothetical protein
MYSAKAEFNDSRIGKILQIADALGVSLFVAPAAQREALRNHIRHAASSESEE